MNQEIKKLWVEALRSGEYKQGLERLKKEMDDGTNTYCCLGVLCDIYQKITNKGRWTNTEFIPEYRVEGEGNIGILPEDVYNWAGLNGCMPDINDVSLSQYNDIEKADFAKIANLIEANL